MSNPERGFFDPRTPEQREQDPFPPLFIERTRSPEKTKIINHFPVFSQNIKDTKLHEIHVSCVKHKSFLELSRDDISQKAEIVIKERKPINTNDYTTAYVPADDENVRLDLISIFRTPK